MAVKKSITSVAPEHQNSPNPAEIIDQAQRDLAASARMISALRSYLVAAGESSCSGSIDIHDFSCAAETLLDVAAETVARATESIAALVASAPRPEGGAE